MPAPRCLLVHYNENFAGTLKSSAETLGAQVTVAGSIGEAQETLKAVPHPFDSIVTPLAHSGAHSREGLDFLRSLRSKYPKTSLVLLSSGAEAALQEHAIEASGLKIVRQDKPSWLTSLMSYMTVSDRGMGVGS